MPNNTRDSHSIDPIETAIKVEETSQHIETLRHLLTSYQNVLNAASDKIELGFQKAINNGFYELLDEDSLLLTQQQIGCSVVGIMRGFYQNFFSGPIGKAVLQNLSDKEIPDYGENIPVSVKISGDTIIAQTPHLLTRITTFKYLGGNRIPQTYSYFFAYEVSALLESMFDEIPQYEQKNVLVLAVYESSERNIPDTDNLDTKAIVDAITRFLPGEDNGACCSFSGISIRSGSIAPGTYFITTPGFGVSPNLDSTIKMLEKDYPAT